MPWTPRISRAMRLISAGVGAPPPISARSRGNSGVSPWRRCASKYARKNGTALPSRVAPCAAMRSGVVAGSKVSNSAPRMPDINAVVSMLIPPMCETGMAMGFTSSAVMPAAWSRPEALCITDRSVWRTPLGSAVVPDDV